MDVATVPLIVLLILSVREHPVRKYKNALLKRTLNYLREKLDLKNKNETK